MTRSVIATTGLADKLITQRPQTIGGNFPSATRPAAVGRLLGAPQWCACMSPAHTALKTYAVVFG